MSTFFVLEKFKLIPQLLIAGTSCVDYSNLNNQQQDIEANGESGRTFRGMLQWVKKNQPAIVILENVCSAPWDKVVEYFAQIDYDAQFTRYAIFV